MKELLVALETQGCCPITGAKLKSGEEIIRFRGKNKTIFLLKKAVDEAVKHLQLIPAPYRKTSSEECAVGVVGVLDYNTIPRNLAAQLYLNSGKKVSEFIERPNKPFLKTFK